jgi:hypothetical protein
MKWHPNRNKILTAGAMLFVWMCSLNLHGQSGHLFFNEWYNPNQQYVKLLVSADGPCRILKSDLQSAGVPNLGGLVASNLQLFYRGREISIFVKETTNGDLDYFEFEGRKNDGAIDSLLYKNPYAPFNVDPQQQPNVHSSFFTDTSAYFLTWDAVATQHRGIFLSQNFANRAPSSSYRNRIQYEYNTSYYQGGGGRSDANHVLNPDYITGEGWVSQEIETGDLPDAIARIVSCPGYVPGGTSRMRARAFGVNASDQHVLHISLNGTEVYRDTTTGITISTRDFTTNFNLSNPNIVVRFQALGTGVRPDKQRVAWFSIDYDRSFNLGGASRTIVRDWMSSDTALFQFLDADLFDGAWIWDPIYNLQIQADVSGDTLRFLIPPSSQPRDLYMYTDKAVTKPIIRPYNSLSNLSDPATEGDFLIITDRRFSNSAQEYALYRDTTLVNRRNSKVVYVDEIMDEFGYGSLTPYAIKNFVYYALENWNNPPDYVMIWGKGQYSPRLSNQFNFIPSFGNPASDFEYVSNFRRDTVDFVPWIPIGRLCIINDQQGLDYLAKVRQYEHTPYASWMKDAVFLGGGQTVSEQASIRDALVNRFMPFIVGPPLSGSVYWYQKTGNGIETNSTLSSHTRIDRGVGLLQFFGHSSTNIFDVDILEANRYTNFGKYPMMVAFGCHGGDFVQAYQSFGERFVLEAGRGAIAYLGNSTEGFLNQLRDYGRHLHLTMQLTQYGKPIGDAIAETIKRYSASNNAPFQILAANHCKQLNLQGDPTITLNFPQKPDLRIQESMVWFSEPLSTQSLNLPLMVSVANDGRTFPDSFLVRITQQLPTGVIVRHNDTIMAPVGLLDTLSIPLPNRGGIASAGLNTFTVEVDALDSLDEYKEDNNITTIQTLIQGASPAIVYPYDFALLGTDTLTLMVGSYSLDNPAPIRYSFEIDTVHTFTSGFKQSSSPVFGTSVAGGWTLPFRLEENKVYYWRCRYTDHYPIEWAKGSFKYKSDRYGWAQSRMPQMVLTDFHGIGLDTTNRQWSFSNQNVQMHAYIQPPSSRAAYFFGSNSSAGEPPNGVMFTSFDQYTLLSSVQETQFGDWRFAAAPSSGDPNTILDVVNLIMEMKEGDYFLMLTNGDAKLSLWQDSYISALALVGVNPQIIADMENGDRFLLFGRKGGAVGSAILITEPNVTTGGERYDLLMNVANATGYGEAVSTRIGPALQWETVNVEWRPLQTAEHDTLMLEVHAIDDQNRMQLQSSNLSEGMHSLQSIQAQTHPYLQLTGEFEDRIQKSAPQLDVWEVYYSPVPDLAADPIVASVLPDTVVEGQIVEAKVGFRNLTRFSSDSVDIKFSLLKSDRNTIPLGQFRMSALSGFEQDTAIIRFHTAGKGLEAGPCHLVFEVNPGAIQREQQFFNNKLLLPFQVVKDTKGPILDVTVDGKHLMEDDYVHPNAEIVIQVNDENPYLPVTISDSTYIMWFGPERTYNFNPQIQISNDIRLKGTPGRLPENKAKLIFTPGPLEDGAYTLAVQSKDFSGNPSGAEPYVVHFNVESDKTVSEVLPYPNPFSSSTRFVYTLTGDEKPYVFEIQIFTVTGRLVKIIDLLEMGEVQLGRNITTYAWDGRDEFGDLLANGVYLYKARIKFKDRFGVKQMETGLEDYFNNGYGKMYIMR